MIYRASNCIKILKIFFVFCGFIASNIAESKELVVEELYIFELECAKLVKSIDNQFFDKFSSASRKYEETKLFFSKNDIEDIRFYFNEMIVFKKLKYCVRMSEILIPNVDRIFNDPTIDFEAYIYTLNVDAQISFSIYKKHLESLVESQQKFLDGNLSKDDLEQKVKEVENTLIPEIESLRSDPNFLKNIAEKKLVIEKRQLAKDDTISQVLNYASGFKEDGSGVIFWSPSKYIKDPCFYRITIDKAHPQAITFLSNFQAERQLNAIGVQRNKVKEFNKTLINGVNLNKGDFQSITFHQSFGPKSLDYFDRAKYKKYQTKIEGLADIFECESSSCSVDRLRRGWDLVSKKCKGATKAF